MSLQKSSLANWIFSTYIILSSYSIGVGFAESLANYPSWSKIGANTFSSYHNTFSEYFAIVFVPAFFLALVAVVLLFWFRPRRIPQWPVWMALCLKLTMLIATITYLGPMSLKLGEQYSHNLMEQMIQADRVMRSFPGGLLVLVNFYMLKCAITDD